MGLAVPPRTEEYHVLTVNYRFCTGHCGLMSIKPRNERPMIYDTTSSRLKIALASYERLL